MRNFLWLSVILLLFFGGRTFILKYVKEKKSESRQEISISPATPATEPEETFLPRPKMPPLPPVHPEIRNMLKKARTLEGSLYQVGGETPQGFDCSGFVRYVYQEIGVVLPRSSQGMALVGQSIERQDARPGDLLFFSGSDAENTEVGHVALVLERKEDQLLMIHASNRGVVIDDFFEMPYYQHRYLSANRPYAE